MRDTCGLLIAGQRAARGDRRATGEQQVERPSGRDTRFGVAAQLSAKRRETIEIVPIRQSDRRLEDFCFLAGPAC